MGKEILLFALLFVAAIALSGCILPKEEEDACAKLSGDERDICYAGKAVNERKEYMCYQVKDIATRDDCRVAVVAAGGTIGCGNIQDKTKEDACFYIAAMNEVDSYYCRSIWDSETRQECYDDVKTKQAQ